MTRLTDTGLLLMVLLAMLAIAAFVWYIYIFLYLIGMWALNKTARWLAYLHHAWMRTRTRLSSSVLQKLIKSS